MDRLEIKAADEKHFVVCVDDEGETDLFEFENSEELLRATLGGMFEDYMFVSDVDGLTAGTAMVVTGRVLVPVLEIERSELH